MGNAVLWKCDTCEFCHENYLTEYRECRKDRACHICGCKLYQRKTTIFDRLKSLFYNLIIGFQDESELANNPEWVKFLEEVNR